MLTNRLNLPEQIVRAVSNDRYTRGASRISVTQLITPPYQRKLMETTERIEDVSDRIWSLLGQSVHHVLERAATEDTLAEQRLFAEIEGWTVSGQFDLIEGDTLFDFKVTSVWSYINGGKREWEEQLNFLRALSAMHAVKTGDLRYDVERLAIIAIFRDHQQSKAGVDGYPAASVAKIDIPVWPLEVAIERMTERVRAHQQEVPAPCTDEERWATKPVYAVMKAGRKSAVRLFDSIESADEMAKSKGKDHSVEYRPQTFRRCESYCSVAHACPHHNSNEGGAF